MKTKLILFISLLTVGFFSCDDDEKPVDPIYEFVSFAEESVNLNELDNSEEAYPIVVQLWAFKPHKEDITLNLEAVGNNTAKDIDFTITPGNTITIPKGRLTSDTIWVKTINNNSGSNDPRTFDLKLVSASDADIKLGLGITNPTNKEVTFNISDDECTLTPDVYETSLDVLISTDGSEMGTNVAQATVTGNTVELTGDLIWYGPMDDPLVLTLVPESAGATKGTVTFGSQFLGTANDGYEYTFTQVGTGTYNVCSGTIVITYDTSYRAVGDTDWTPWQRVINSIQIQ